MAEGEEYKIKIEGPGVNLERSVAAGIARRVTFLLMGGSASEEEQAALEGDRLARRRQRSRFDSLAEFVSEHGAESYPQKVTAIGYFLREYRDTESFSRDNYIAGFSEARDPAPQNLSREIGKAIRRGWIAQRLEEDGVYFLTTSGDKAVENKFPPTPRGRKRARRKQGAKKSRAK